MVNSKTILNKNKRALSGIITTILLVALVLVASGLVFFAIKQIIGSSEQKIFQSQKLIENNVNLKIEEAKINNLSDRLTVRIKRELGKGNLTSIKFIVSNEDVSRTITKRTYMKELEKETFIFPISDFNLNSVESKELSVAPVIIIDEEDFTRDITDTKEIKITFEEIDISCTQDTDCGTSKWLEDTAYCSGTDVFQSWREYSCVQGLCEEETTNQFKEDCTLGDEICFDGFCLSDEPSCTRDSDCGQNTWIANTASCQNEQVWQTWKEYSCVEGFCQENLSETLKEDCGEQEKICFNGECYLNLECFEDSDCEVWNKCEENKCVPESLVNSGTIYSIWPLGVGIFFDSEELPKSGIDYGNYHVKFSGPESQCLRIERFVLPKNPEERSFIQLNDSANIQEGETYYIWETLWNCYN